MHRHDTKRISVKQQLTVRLSVKDAVTCYASTSAGNGVLHSTRKSYYVALAEHRDIGSSQNDYYNS
jgi:hypothetical protein